MTTYTNPKNGAQISSNLTIEEAANILRPLKENNNFLRDLLIKRDNLSSAQKYWFFKLAMDNAAKGSENAPLCNVAQRNGITAGGGFAKLHEMFQTAKKSIKKPKITFEEPELGKLVLSLASDTSTNPNYIYLKNNDIYMGKISPLGEFFSSRDCTDDIKQYVTNFANNPVEFASNYGRKIGSCCFCARLLTDNRSVTVGYGPICANSFGLPWG